MNSICGQHFYKLQKPVPEIHIVNEKMLFNLMTDLVSKTCLCNVFIAVKSFLISSLE